MNLIPAFSTPIWQSEYPDFEEHKELFLKSIREYKEKNPSVQKTNIKGYQSQGTLHLVDELRPLFNHICGLIFKCTSDLEFIECDAAITSAWLNVNDSRECMNHEHIHGDIFSGVFYLKVPDGSGKLSFTNIGLNKMWKGCDLVERKSQYTADFIKIDPVEGNIFMFPSYLPHSVEMNDHEDERISISFNIIVLPKGTIKR